jgi:hypothetical protein
MQSAVKTFKPGWSDYRIRRVLQHAHNFAKGLLIGGIVVMLLWVVLG